MVLKLSMWNFSNIVILNTILLIIKEFPIQKILYITVIEAQLRVLLKRVLVIT